MGTKTNSLGRYHEIISTKHVFLEDEQVFLKSNTNEPSNLEIDKEEWSPINFQWIAIVELNTILNHQSNQ